MSVRGAAFLGIGAMVGAGIFGTVAAAAVWPSFLAITLLSILLDHVWKHARGAEPRTGAHVA